MKKRNAALYDPYLDVLGGGEKHILSILKILQDEGYEITIFWDKDLNKSFDTNLNLKFDPQIKFQKNIFKSGNFLNKAFTLNRFDIFFYVTDGSYFFSTAKNNYVFSMVPKKNLYEMNTVNRLKTLNYKFIANSQFTHDWLKRWKINSQVIYPFLDEDYLNLSINNIPKEKIILSVGRFFKHLHSKKQDVIINAFRSLKHDNPKFKDYKLILAGGLKQEDKNYLKELENIIGHDDSIILKTNISHTELFDLYKKSLIYWHFTGHMVNEEINPHLVEHLGITPMEAMSMGCITFCFNAGGPKEIINEGKNGFLFNDLNELENKMNEVIENKILMSDIQKNAKDFIKSKFNYSIFKEKVKEVVLKI
ncbi:MAG: glycosyltransferase family 4 protein [Candidatus Roizmanbacteria bacterium]|nr:MAG: glycosyltransferase family 4 protein [Candidatus Roizmanbacteria bacterium]